MNDQRNEPASGTLFGHPTGLFTLFFAEMWERFSYYGMRALLVFYMIKGFLGYGDSDAYAVYGAYTALVYMTPFFGGLLADRLLGARRAVVLGGLLMAAGHLMMTLENDLAFFTALALLILGNGFFKPNISTIVGTLYPQRSVKRDGGFTIFYMGINLGAAMSPLLCGYIGETFGWHYGFGLATIGMLTGLAVFVAPTLVTQVVIMSGAVAAAAGLFIFRPDDPIAIGINVLVGIALLVAGVIALTALSRGGLPTDAGAPPDQERLRRPLIGPLTAEWGVYLGTLIAIPLFVLLVSGFAPLTENKRGIAIIPDWVIERLAASEGPLAQVLVVVVKETSRPAGLILFLSGLAALVYIGLEMVRLSKVPRERLYVVLILTFFSMLFWSFFEQAGSSVNNFTDRNVDRVTEASVATAADVGRSIQLRVPFRSDRPEISELPLLSQEQLGHRYGEPLQARIEQAIRSEEQRKGAMSPEDIEAVSQAATADRMLNITALSYLRAAAGQPDAEREMQVVQWDVSAENEGMGLGGTEVPASLFQAANPVFILFFGLIFSGLWTFLGTRGWEPSTPVKFAMGLIQLGMGFGAFWYGAQNADERGIVLAAWLLLGYLFQTTGELCLSPVGLSMITRLSPGHLVSTVMGMWFLATAFSQFLAAIIAQFTGVGHGDEGASLAIPVPLQTVDLYGGVFGKIALAAITSGLVCLLLSPRLKRWMHEDDSLEAAE